MLLLHMSKYLYQKKHVIQSKSSKITNSTQHTSTPPSSCCFIKRTPSSSPVTYVSARKFVLHIVTHVKDKGPNLIGF